MQRNKKSAMMTEVVVAAIASVTGVACFAMAQTRHPYSLTQIRYCPQSANNPAVINERIAELNRRRAKQKPGLFDQYRKPSREARLEDFDLEAQRELDEKYCHQPRFVLTEEWERYGSYGSSLPFKGDAITWVATVPIENPNYVFYSLGTALSLWTITACVRHRANKLSRLDFKISEEDKTLYHQVWLDANAQRAQNTYLSSLDSSVAADVLAQQDVNTRIQLGLTDPELEAQKARLQNETVLLKRKAYHSDLEKQIAVNYKEVAKANSKARSFDKDEIQEKKPKTPTKQAIFNQGNNIVEAVKGFGLPVEYKGATTSPSVIRHRFKFTAEAKGKKIADVKKLSEDIALKLGLQHEPKVSRDRGDIIVEVPRAEREFPKFDSYRAKLAEHKGGGIAILGGIDIDGKLLFWRPEKDNDKHALVSGTTGSGKTQGVFAQLAALCEMYSPRELQIAIYDGKMGLKLPESLNPWLFCTTHKATQGAEFIDLIEAERAKRMSDRGDEGYINISEYNADQNPESKYPFLLVLFDEYSVDREAFEGSTKKGEINKAKELCKLARSENIAIVIVDQDQKDENVGNRVKANTGGRFCYRMLDSLCSGYVGIDGAEKLLGKGDLITRIDSVEHRAQMPFATPETLKEVCDRRVRELGLTTDKPQKKPIKDPGEDWMRALFEWALSEEFVEQSIEAGDAATAIALRWERLSGCKPSNQDLAIFLENLRSFNS